MDYVFKVLLFSQEINKMDSMHPSSNIFSWNGPNGYNT